MEKRRLGLDNIWQKIFNCYYLRALKFIILLLFNPVVLHLWTYQKDILSFKTFDRILRCKIWTGFEIMGIIDEIGQFKAKIGKSALFILNKSV